jgi:hypothetical protein
MQNRECWWKGISNGAKEVSCAFTTFGILFAELDFLGLLLFWRVNNDVVELVDILNASSSPM